MLLGGRVLAQSMKILRGMKNDKNKEDECDVARRNAKQ